MKSTPDATYFSISQNDWGNYCQCPRCQELADREESQMGPVLQLVNRVAEAVADEFPDKRITTLAYQWSRKPPQTLRPRPNVTIRLCSIECCFTHPLPGCDYPANVQFCKDLEGWSAICDDLWIWNYTTNFRNYYLPHPVLRALDDDIRFFVEHNVKGVYEQDTKLTPHGEMSDLGGYIMAQFLWNPEYDEDTAINEFLEAVYEDAAPQLRAYIDLLHDKVETDKIHLRCYVTPDQAKFLTDEVLAVADHLFDLAEEAVADRPDVLRRVRFARMPVDYAIVERTARGKLQLMQVDHPTFTVTPLSNVSRYAERFMATADEAGVKTMSERRFTLDEYAKTLTMLLTAPPDAPRSRERRSTRAGPCGRLLRSRHLAQGPEIRRSEARGHDNRAAGSTSQAGSGTACSASSSTDSSTPRPTASTASSCEPNPAANFRWPAKSSSTPAASVRPHPFSEW